LVEYQPYLELLRELWVENKNNAVKMVGNVCFIILPKSI